MTHVRAVVAAPFMWWAGALGVAYTVTVCVAEAIAGAGGST